MQQVDLSLYRFYSPSKVRFSETDANGHMSHLTTVIYMEQARTDFMTGLGLFGREQLEAEGKTFVLAGQTVTYRSQAYFNDPIDTYLRVSRIGNSSLDMEYVLVNRQTSAVVSTGTSTMVYFDVRQQRSTPLPADLGERIAKFEAAFSPF
jgi:acyl-CoA thioester hydrolase